MRDVRHVLRCLSRAPGYVVAVVGVVALVLTLGATALAIVDGVLFRPLPYPAADRLFTLTPGFIGMPPAERANASYRDIETWAEAVPEAGITGFIAGEEAFGESVNNYLEGVVHVQQNIFDVIGVQPLFGGFQAEDFLVTTATLPAIVTHDLWQGRFEGDPEIVGRTVIVDPTRDYGFRVVGVMPPGFVFPTRAVDARLIVPFVMDRAAREEPTRRSFAEVIARVPYSITTEDFRFRIEARMPQVAALFAPLGPKPDAVPEAAWRRQGPYERVNLSPLGSTLGSSFRPVFLRMFAAVLLVVLLGALNASGLMATAITDRKTDFGVLRALGAPRQALARLVLLEGFILFGIAAAIAIAAAPILVQVLLRLLPPDVVLMTPWPPSSLSLRLMGLIAAGALVLAAFASAFPMLRVLSSNLPLAAGASRSATAPRTFGRSVLLAGQVAGAVVVTVVGALLVGSVLAVYGRPVPAKTDGVLAVEVMPIGPGMNRIGKSPVRADRLLEALEGVHRIPGVEKVAVTSGRLLTGRGWGSWFVPPDGIASPFSTNRVDFQTVSSEYFDLISPKLVSGRFPTGEELTAGAPVIVVSEAVAKSYWPGGSPLGRTLTESDGVIPYEVIGVVEDVPWLTREEGAPSIYGPYSNLTRGASWTFLVEPREASKIAPDAVVQALLDAGVPVMPTRAGSLDSLFRDSIRGRRFRAWLFGSIAVGALSVVAVGMLAMVAMSSGRRTREIGIRQALGATRSGIVRLIVRGEADPVFLGLGVGLPLAAWAVGIVRAGSGIVGGDDLFGVTVTDARIWMVAVGLVLVAATLGALLPALRASRTDLAVVLRME